MGATAVLEMAVAIPSARESLATDTVASVILKRGGRLLWDGTGLGTGFDSGTACEAISNLVIFITSRSINDPMLSFMMPSDLMTNLTVEQPVFAANFIKGTIQAAPYGGWEGQATFKLVFRNGGAIEFAQLMVKAASSGLVPILHERGVE
ncbi:hypothetical protein H8959_007361, partial [Pygathrix nigripes]